ncbi:sensor histidine kinase [Halobaculum sp. EA56]|uniref:sensor histidine kinase n=1 Tax=Halobaculum sp. EA56 TaxID=3421648 RepID=UPI003EC10EDE
MTHSRGARLAPVALAGTVLALAVAHLFLDDDRLAVELAEASILVVFAAALAFVAARVRRERHDRDRVGRIVSTSLGSGIVVGALSALYLAARTASGEPVSEGWFVVSIGWSLGASAGAVVGYYVERVRRERAEQTRLSGRLTVLQRVLRHNIRNEVTVIRGLASNAIESTDDPDISSQLGLLCDHADRVYGLSEKAQTLANLWADTSTVETDLAGLTRAEVERFREANPDADVRLSSPDRATAVTHPDVRAAVRETLENVAEHNETRELSVEVSVERDGAWTAVEVVDDGSSIPEEELAALSASRELPLQHVTGLGLWVIYWVVDLSEGDLDIDNLDPRGVRVCMRFRSAGTPE